MREEKGIIMNNNIQTWQLCPKCEGAVSAGGFLCNICLGKGIISTFAGKPPKDKK